jgi:hypothetical protein
VLTNWPRPAGGGPAVYAQLYIPRKPVKVIDDPAAVPDEQAVADFRRTQEALLRSRLVLNAALRSPEVNGLSVLQGHDDPIDWLAGALRIDSPTSPEVLRVGLDGDRTDELRKIVNAVVGAYVREVVSKEASGRKEQLARLNDIAAKTDETVRRKREMIRQLTEADGPTEAERQLLNQDLLDCRRDLRRIRLARAAVAKGENTDALAAQEKILREEEKELLARLRPARAVFDVEGQRAELKRAEDLALKIRTTASNLALELDAPPRVMVLEDARDRSGDRTARR